MVIIHVFLRVNNAWQGSNLGPERGGAQPSGKPLLYGESISVAESCGARRSGPWPPRQRLTAPLQTLPALRGGRAASECARKGLHPSSHGGHSRRATAKYHPGYDGVPGGAQGLRALTFVSITIRTLPGSTTLATKLLKTASNSPQKNNHVPFMTHPLAPRSERGASDIGDAGLL